MSKGIVTVGKRTPIEGAVEWCFRINNEEVTVFATAEKNDPLKIEIPAELEANIIFSSDKGMFEIFPREMVEAEVVEELKTIEDENPT